MSAQPNLASDLSELFNIAELINKAIAKLLGSDPANQTFVERLNGSRIHISSTAPVANILISIDDAQIQLRKLPVNDETPSDLQISGTAISLLKLLTTPLENASALRDSNVQVQGDVGLLLQLSQVAKMIEIDWELLLADQIGETPAVLLSRAITLGLSEARKLQTQLFAKLEEAAQPENDLISSLPVKALPTKDELKDLRAQLRELNYRLDRLDAQRKMDQAAK